MFQELSSRVLFWRFVNGYGPYGGCSPQTSCVLVFFFFSSYFLVLLFGYLLLLLCYGFGNWDWGVKALSAYARLLVFLCIFLKASLEAAFIYDDNVKLAS